MTYAEVLERARAALSPRCTVCPVCNGRACAGRIPGPGGKGTGATAQRNFSYLAEHVKVEQRVLRAPFETDCTLELAGKQFATPIFAAPIGLIEGNYASHLTERTYAEAVVTGTQQAGSVAFTGGGSYDGCFLEPLEVIAQAGGWGVPTLKPWRMELVEERIRLSEQAHAIAIAMDIDTAGLPHANKSTNALLFKSQDDLRRIAEMTELPFFVKGIMTADEAVLAAEAGVYGIIVSNHGGRVLDHGLSTAEVLPEIRAAVGKRVKVLADGGVRSGVDAFKLLALGADAVLIGRPYAIAAFGGGAEGVRLYTEKVTAELRDTMAMTGCRTLSDISAKHVRIV
ncbi:MAG: alpha-hydroxy-acid oxidizing protein [Oscillospiraceae bacterium]